jgi:integrase
MRKTLSDRSIAALKPRQTPKGPKRRHVPDPQLPVHYVRVEPSGVKSFWVAPRDPTGKQKWVRIGEPGLMSLDEARELARTEIRRIREGKPAEAKAETFAAVAAGWITRHVIKNGLRSRYEITRLLNKHILPAWKDREFISIRRSDITRLLDDVEDHHGARQADYCLNITRAIANWYAARNDDYQPPFVRGMRRQSPAALARARVLENHEIRAVWKAAESSGTFGAIVRMCLLCAQRRTKVINMRWSDVSEAGEWKIPREPREKDTAGFLQLPQAALDIIAAQPQLGSNPYIFAGITDGPLGGRSIPKARLDKACGVTGWRLHDLRRTARSLMSRAGVQRDISERVLGHALPGVEGIYDRQSYRDEKADALKRLAELIDSIVHPRPAHVVPMGGKRRSVAHR